VFNTLIPLSRELWPLIDSVMPSCCSRMTASVELATCNTTPGTSSLAPRVRQAIILYVNYAPHNNKPA